MAYLKIIISYTLLLTACYSYSQKHFTKSGSISFYSDTPMEKIEAHSKSAVAVLDTESGNFEFSVLIKSFHFDRALMEEHFNENYMETSQYPKSTFKGKITNLSQVNFSKKGTYSVKVSGDLNMHGVTKNITTDGTLKIDDKGIHCYSEFIIAVADYKIVVPALVRESIAKNVTIKVSAPLNPLKK